MYDENTDPDSYLLDKEDAIANTKAMLGIDPNE